MFDLIVYSLAVFALVILMFGALGVGLVLTWLVVAVIAWDRTRPEVL